MEAQKLRISELSATLAQEVSSSASSNEKYQRMDQRAKELSEETSVLRGEVGTLTLRVKAAERELKSAQQRAQETAKYMEAEKEDAAKLRRALASRDATIDDMTWRLQMANGELDSAKQGAADLGVKVQALMEFVVVYLGREKALEIADQLRRKGMVKVSGNTSRSEMPPPPPPEGREQHRRVASNTPNSGVRRATISLAAVSSRLSWPGTTSRLAGVAEDVPAKSLDESGDRSSPAAPRINLKHASTDSAIRRTILAPERGKLSSGMLLVE